MCGFQGKLTFNSFFVVSIDDPEKWVIEEDETENLETMEILISRTLTNSLELKVDKCTVEHNRRLASIPDDSESSQESMKKICFQLISTESVNLGSSFDIFLDRQILKNSNNTNGERSNKNQDQLLNKIQECSNKIQESSNKIQGRSNRIQEALNEDPHIK